MNISGKIGCVVKRVLFDSGFQKKLEWIEWRQIRDQVYIDQELTRLFLKKETRQTIMMQVQLQLRRCSVGVTSSE